MKKIKKFLCGLLRLGVLCVCIPGSICSSAIERPNIIFILADDQGYGDVGALNAECKIPTPNLDRMAKEGMIFTDAHSSSSVCTPTRYSVLTGRYHWRTHLQSGVLGGFSRPLIAPRRLTVADLLRESGYHTACIGKWHLGLDWPLKDDGGVADDRGDFSAEFARGWDVDYAGKIENGPTARGFDYFFGISASLDMPPYVYIENDRATELAAVEKAFPRKGPAGEKFEAIDVLPRITAKTVEYIRERAEGARNERPFFIYFPLNAPHTPIVPAKEWEGRSGINPYADFVMQVDETVGEVLRALDENGFAEDTLVIFTADNGCSPAAKIDELQKEGHYPSYIYRGHKADIYEGGHRVPFIVRWPGKVRPGSVSHPVVCQVDLLATCAEIVGAELPENAGEDSISFLPVLLGKDEGKQVRETLISQSIHGSFAVRQGKWKLALCPGSGGWSFPRPGRDDLTGLPRQQLFDLETDPGEERNVDAEHPETSARLRALLERCIAEGRSTPGPPQQNDAEIEIVKPVPEPAPKKKK